ncbi:hypothetical protein D9M71_493230 [compost metagenome]
MKPAMPINAATSTAPVAHLRVVKRSSRSHSLPKPRCAAARVSIFRARSAAFLPTPMYDSATGISNSEVKISTATPILAVTARSWITGMSISISTAKPTASANSAVTPATNRRRKV